MGELSGGVLWSRGRCRRVGDSNQLRLPKWTMDRSTGKGAGDKAFWLLSSVRFEGIASVLRFFFFFFFSSPQIQRA